MISMSALSVIVMEPSGKRFCKQLARDCDSLTSFFLKILATTIDCTLTLNKNVMTNGQGKDLDKAHYWGLSFE